jgi:hypothetical protein
MLKTFSSVRNFFVGRIQAAAQSVPSERIVLFWSSFTHDMFLRNRKMNRSGDGVKITRGDFVADDH